MMSTMTALENRPNTALLVIDVQNEVMAEAHDRDGVVGNIGSLVDRARSKHVPVVWVQHHDEGLPRSTDNWQIVPELEPSAEEPVVHKTMRDSFQDTTLEEELARAGVGRLVIVGAQTDFCVRWTLHGALTRGYHTVLVSDGHTTDATSPSGMPNGSELIAHTNSIWASQEVAGCETSVADAADVRF